MGGDIENTENLDTPENNGKPEEISYVFSEGGQSP